MSKKDVLVTDYVHPMMLEGLRKLGYSTTYAPEMSRKEMESALPSYVGVVINTRCALDRETIGKASSLLWIARLGSGLDIIDLPAAEENGIYVVSAPEGNAQAVAEHVMGMLLCLANNLIAADQEVRSGAWLREKNRGWEISGKTIGIIGYGNNGSALAGLLRSWNVRMMVHDRYKSGFANEYVHEVSLHELLREADIISFHVPLTDETRGMINNEFIRQCKKGVVIVNAARGKITQLPDLVDAIRSGYVKGACMDVFPFEPPSAGDEQFKLLFEELCTFPNVVLSPHVGGWTTESKRKISEVLIEKLTNFKTDNN